MSVLDSIRDVHGDDGDTADPDNDVHYRCEFCDGEFETAYSFCPDCGSERIAEVA